MASKEIASKLEQIGKSKNINLRKFKHSEDINQVPMPVLEQYFREVIDNNAISKENTTNWNLHIASPSDIATDIQETIDNTKALSSFTLSSNLAPRSTIGHAHAGHSTFSGNSKVNTTLDDVISNEVLGLLKKNDKQIYINKRDYLDETQSAIDNIGNFVHDAVENPNRMLDATQGGIKKPLFGIPFWNVFDSQALLQGIFYGGYFDNYDQIRSNAEKKYDVKIGGGSTYLIHKPTIQKLGINLTELTKGDYHNEILANLNSENRIQLFKNIGLIKDTDEIDFSDVETWNDVKDQCSNILTPGFSDYFQEYIRYEKGKGVSDDIACMAAAWIDFNPLIKTRDGHFYKSLSNGANINDFVDTITKASTLYVPGGFDEAISKFANSLWLKKVKNNSRYRENHNINLGKLEKKLQRQGTEDFALVFQKEIQDLTAVSKNPDFAEIHSSARYFVQMFEGSYALEQWSMLNQRRLREHGAEVEIVGKKGRKTLFEEKININLPIGFQKINLNKIINYADSLVFPSLADPENRGEIIQNRYSSKENDSKYV